MTRFVRKHAFTLKKTASYYVMHITVAASVAYAVTGDALMALTLSLLEPSVQALAYFAHEKAWSRAARTQARADAQSELATAQPA